MKIDDIITIHEMEKILIIKALKRHNGNKTKAAKDLGIYIKTLYNKLHEYGLFEQFQIGKNNEN